MDKTLDIKILQGKLSGNRVVLMALGVAGVWAGLIPAAEGAAAAVALWLCLALFGAGGAQRPQACRMRPDDRARTHRPPLHHVQETST